MRTRMPKVLFHYSVLNVGGAEMSVLRMTRFLADHGWEVELVLSTGGGTLEYCIDPRVKVIHLREWVAGYRFLRERHPIRKLLWLLLDGIPFLYTRVQWLIRALQYRFRFYDAAIISLHGLSPSFCCRWVRARKRLQWIRNDLSKCDPDGLASRNILKYHRWIDHYVCVSGTAYQSFVTLFPELEVKALTLYNIIDSNEMLVQAAKRENPYVAYGNVLKVVTVCRLSDKSKGILRMLKVHRRLYDEGIDFRWFVVGDGSDHKKLKHAILENDMEGIFILLGRKDNPYSYYQYADIVATLSYYEGLCGAVNEAKIMGKPVIATCFSGIEEQLTDGINGLIVDNNEQSIFFGMKRLLTDATLRAKLTNNILPEKITNDEYKLEVLENII